MSGENIEETLKEKWAVRCETCGFIIENLLYSVSSAEVSAHSFYHVAHRVYNYDMDKPRVWADIYGDKDLHSVHSKGGYEPIRSFALWCNTCRIGLVERDLRLWRIESGKRFVENMNHKGHDLEIRLYETFRSKVRQVKDYEGNWRANLPKNRRQRI